MLSRHLRRERVRHLRAAKIAASLAARGSLSCEVCGFDFEAVYSPRGRGFAEVHHRLPLHVSSETRTTLPDLAILCANSHDSGEDHRSAWWSNMIGAISCDCITTAATLVDGDQQLVVLPVF